jgi:Tol biopolymer transport system component
VNKRAIAILGAIFILIVGTLGFLIYSRSKSKNTATETNTNTNTTPVAPVEETPAVQPEPEAAPAQALRLTDDPVISPILFYTGAGISYFNSQGQLFQTDLDVKNATALLSNKRELSIALKAGISKIIWPPAGNSFIAQTGTATKPSWSYYDSTKAAYSDLPSQVYSIDWLPSGDKVVLVWVDANGKASLQYANPDASGYQTLTTFYQSDNLISVSPDGKNVLFYRNQTADNTKNTINMVSTDGKNFSAVVKDGYNFGVQWSPDSKKFLFTKRDSGTQKFALWVADLATGDVRNLGVFTSQTKAVWSKDSSIVYAGVPTTGVAGQGLTQDTIQKITISSGQLQELAPGVAVDVEDLFLSSDESVLFFRNAQDNALYYIPTSK